MAFPVKYGGLFPVNVPSNKSIEKYVQTPKCRPVHTLLIKNELSIPWIAIITHILGSKKNYTHQSTEDDHPSHNGN